MIEFFKELERKYLLANSIKEIDLVCFRTIYCLLAALQLYFDMTGAKVWYDHSPYYIPVSFFHLLGLHSKPTYSLYWGAQLFCIFSLVGLSIGRWRMFFGLSSLLSFLWVSMVKYSLDAIPSSSYIWHTRNIVVFIIIGLTVVDSAPLGRALKENWEHPRSRALFSYITILLCFSYLSSILTRLTYIPLNWLSGEAIAGFLASFGIARGDKTLLELSLNKPLVIGMTLASTITELFCWIMLGKGWLKYLIVTFALGFHVGNLIIGFANFLPWFSFSYLIFIPYGRIIRLLVNKAKVRV